MPQSLQLQVPPFPMLSLAEMQRRYQAAQRKMADLQIDALFLSQDENVQYFAGTSPSMTLNFSLTRPYMVIVPASGSPVAITLGRSTLAAQGYIGDVRPYNELLSFPLDTVVATLKDLRLDRARVGFELGHEQRMGIPVGSFLALQQQLPSMQCVDAGPLLVGLRMIKSAEEVALMRQAADITGRARQRLFRHEKLRAGITERQVDRLMRQLILEEGGDRTSFVILQDPRPGSASAFKTDRPLQRGQILAIDAGAYAGMYTIDYARMAILGKATDEHKRVYDAVRYVNREMTRALRPGITCADLFDVCMKAIRESGAEVDDPGRLVNGRMGHGQGMIITEPPSVMKADTTTLEPGMIISTEPGVRIGSVEFLYEDVHVITETGADCLTTESDELFERLDF